MSMSKAGFEQILGERLLMVNMDLEKVWIPEKDFSMMTVQEIRTYVTFFVDLGYQSLVKVPYENKRAIIDNLNMEWDRRAGIDFTRIYNYLDGIKIKEKWGGEERYKFFSYSFKGYTEFAVLKQTKAILNFLNENQISVDTGLTLMELTGKRFYWDMAKEEDCHYMESKNKQYQDEFVDYVLDEPVTAKNRPWFNEKFEVRKG